MSGNKVLNHLNLTNNRIQNLGTPSASTDATNKQYVDDTIIASIEGIKTKDPVRVASQANITDLAAAITSLDGVSLNPGDRILVKSQTTQSQNGIYTLDASSIPVRSLDANAWAELYHAHLVVYEGTDASKSYRSTIASTGTLGTTAINFAVHSSGNVDASLLKKKYNTTIGDGSATTITVTHNLNDTDVSVTAKEISSGELVSTTIVVTDANNVALTFGTAPASNAIRVTVLA